MEGLIHRGAYFRNFTVFYVIVILSTISFKVSYSRAHAAYVCIIYEKTKGANLSYKLKRSIENQPSITRFKVSFCSIPFL